MPGFEIGDRGEVLMTNEAKTVLIVEDNEINMKLIVAVLELGQYRVLMASDAETGLALAQEYHPDLILMDLQLPGMDGISATALLKADEKLKKIPIIALTGYASDGFGKTLEEAGFSGLITKPFGVRSFLETISGYLEEVPGPQILKKCKRNRLWSMITKSNPTRGQEGTPYRLNV